MDISYILMIVLGFILSNYFNAYKTYHLKQKNQELKDELNRFIQKNLNLESKLIDSKNHKSIPTIDIYSIKSTINDIHRIIKDYDSNLDNISSDLKDTKYMIYQLHKKHYKD